MRKWMAWSVLLAVVSAFLPGSVQAESAEQAFASGKRLLAEADFPGALPPLPLRRGRTKATRSTSRVTPWSGG